MDRVESVGGEGALRTAKARSLVELARLVEVPPFEVVGRGTVRPRGNARAQWIVRGCTAGEDGARSSQAGQSPTIGPVTGAGVARALEEVFSHRDVEECIVQEWVEGASGVALSLPEGEWLVEYARAPGGVTAGRVSPFCALLPDGSAKYARLREGLSIIGRAFGPSDVEFVGLDPPRFVQARPLTSAVTVDRELVRVKAALQELDVSCWISDSFCTDLMERPALDDAWIELYCAVAPEAYEELTGVRPRIDGMPFLKVGRQLFRSEDLGRSLHLSHWQGFRLGLGCAGVLGKAEAVLARESATPRELMKIAIELNLHSELPTARFRGRFRRLFALRERCRVRLSGALARGERASDVPCSRRLRSTLRLDHSGCRWLEAGWFDGQGVEVVCGMPADAPVQVYDGVPEQVGDRVCLRTEELYPELGSVLHRVAGIRCSGGGWNSHLAILCREAGIPLIIQAGGELRGDG